MKIDIVEEKIVYNGFFKIKQFILRHSLFRGGETSTITRELFCRGTSVGVLLYDPQSDRVGLVKQFRIGCLGNEHGAWVWEVIAGINDKAESPAAVACREVKEESGFELDEDALIPVCNYYSSPGGTDERLQLYCALSKLDETERFGGVAGETEDILFRTFDRSEAIGAILNGTINNAATIIALQWLELNKASLQNPGSTYRP